MRQQHQMNLLAKAETVDVLINPLVALWLKEKAKRDPVAFCRLAQDNRERFKRLLGKSGHVTGGQHHEIAWGVEELGIPLFLTSNELGSVYRIHYPGGEKAFATDRKMGAAITAYLERLLQDLSGFGTSRR